ncbi:MAG: hypothetical protein AAGG75_15085 [Bacteroidota bacterium]
MSQPLLLRWMLVLSVTLCFAACSNDDDTDVTPEPTVEKLAMITSVQADQLGNRAYYLQKTPLGATGMVDNSNATELTASGAAMVHHYKGNIYFSDFSDSSIEKWKFDENDEALFDGKISVLDIVYQGNTWFENDNTAYVGGATNEIIIFNPLTMQRTGKIDFSAFSRVGEVTDFPTPGAEIVAESVNEIFIRDNILFAALYPMSEFSTFTPGAPGCHIIVVDLNKVDPNSSDNSDAVIKRIYDERASATGAAAGGGSTYMRLDENNDLYLLCHNAWANHRQTYGTPAAILKIASGSTEFDDYFFDLESASGGSGIPVTNFEYYGNGKFMASVQDPSQINPNDPFSYFNDPIYQWWNFDLSTKTAQKVSEEYTLALIALSYFKDGYGYLPFLNQSESYLMKVDLNTLEATKQFETNGAPQLFELE